MAGMARPRISLEHHASCWATISLFPPPSRRRRRAVQPRAAWRATICAQRGGHDGVCRTPTYSTRWGVSAWWRPAMEYIDAGPVILEYQRRTIPASESACWRCSRIAVFASCAAAPSVKRGGRLKNLLTPSLRRQSRPWTPPRRRVWGVGAAARGAGADGVGGAVVGTPVRILPARAATATAAGRFFIGVDGRGGRGGRRSVTAGIGAVIASPPRVHAEGEGRARALAFGTRGARGAFARRLAAAARPPPGGTRCAGHANRQRRRCANTRAGARTARLASGFRGLRLAHLAEDRTDALVRIIGLGAFRAFRNLARLARQRFQQFARHRLDRDLLLDEGFDVRQADGVALAGEADGIAFRAEARRAADAVQ